MDELLGAIISRQESHTALETRWGAIFSNSIIRQPGIIFVSLRWYASFVCSFNYICVPPVSTKCARHFDPDFADLLNGFSPHHPLQSCSSTTLRHRFLFWQCGRIDLGCCTGAYQSWRSHCDAFFGTKSSGCFSFFHGGGPPLVDGCVDVGANQGLGVRLKFPNNNR